MTKIPVNSIKLSPEELELCKIWNGGPDCRLSEVYRRGGVFLGPVRPNNCAGEPMCNEEWYYTVWCGFAAAIGYACNQARKSYDKDVNRLDRLGRFVDRVCESLEEDYNLCL